MTHQAKRRLAGVMGWPAAHSKSPAIHGYWLRRYELSGFYVPMPVAPEAFGAALAVLPKLGFAGVNVTLPHKETACRLVDEASPEARRLGAVNTITFRLDGSSYGDNTDGYGFIENLRAGAPGWRAAAGPAVVLGAGGAARAVVGALIDAGAPEIRLINRTRARAEILAEMLGGPIVVVDWAQTEMAMDGAALAVNTTSLGMHGQPPLNLCLDRLPPHAVATDIVYAPLMTAFLEKARDRGLATVDGLGMLIHQARPGFESWFGVSPEVDQNVRRAALGGIPGGAME